MDYAQIRPTGVNESEVSLTNVCPTRVRWRIMAMLMLTVAVNTVGRLNFGVLGKYIQDEFSLSTLTMGWIFTAFSLAYHPFQIPGGWAGDRYGPRKVLTVSILLWSAATAAMALVARLAISGWLELAWAFAILRFLIGMGEAPASPNTAKVVASWMGPDQRGVGVSFHILGIGVGGALAPVVITWMAQHWGWRPCFYLSSFLGTLVALSWWFYATDLPERHSGVNAAELALIRPAGEKLGPHTATDRLVRNRPPWGRMLSSVSVWAILLSYFCQGYTPYIYVTWFFIYLVRVRGLTMMQGGFWGSTPFIAIILLTPVGGWLSDLAVAKFGKRRGRQSIVWLGMGCSAMLLWAGSHALNNTAAILMLAFAAGFNYFAASSWWATCIDLTPTYSGSLSGLMNTFSGAWLAPILTAYIATHFWWTQALDVAALLTALGALLWIFVNADENLEEISLPSVASTHA
jgi:ACS family glucarate transporter-like MFS transporter